jgi:hypothetical protein
MQACYSKNLHNLLEKNTDNKPYNSMQASIHNTKHANFEDSLLMAA